MASHGATIRVDSPQASVIVEVMLMAPGAVTHGFNQTQRAIECAIAGGDAAGVDIVTPSSASIAPPGFYLLFLIDANRVPSVDRWILLR